MVRRCRFSRRGASCSPYPPALGLLSPPLVCSDIPYRRGLDGCRTQQLHLNASLRLKASTRNNYGVIQP